MTACRIEIYAGHNDGLSCRLRSKHGINIGLGEFTGCDSGIDVRCVESTVLVGLQYAIDFIDRSSKLNSGGVGRSVLNNIINGNAAPQCLADVDIAVAIGISGQYR